MLRFFRQIRQRLVTDNKFSKYLLYAIGEIMLVVIGILIAFQVDSWNEDRKNRQLELAFLERLKADMAQDTIYLTQRISLSDSIIKNGEFYQLQMYRPQKDFGEYVDLTNIYVWDSEGFLVQKVTYNEMVNSGAFNLISNSKLKEQILSHYFRYEAIESHINEMNEFSTRELSKIISIYFKKDNVVNILENTDLNAEMDWSYINDPLSREFIELEGAVIGYKNKHETFKEYYEESLISSRSLIDQISKEIEEGE